MTQKEERQIRQEKVYNAIVNYTLKYNKAPDAEAVYLKYFYHPTHINKKEEYNLSELNFDHYICNMHHEVKEDMSLQAVVGSLNSLVRQKKIAKKMLVETNCNGVQYCITRYYVNENAE